MSQLISSKIPLILIIFPLLFILSKSQLTIQDKNVIENYILQSQSKNTGLFFEAQEPYKHTKEAISVLNILGLQVKYAKEICKNLSEAKIDANVVAIDQLLKCKIDFKTYKPDFTKQKLVDLYHEAQIMDFLKLKDWKELFKKIKHFMISENGKFSLFKIKEGKKKSLIATAIGIELMVLISEKDEELKNEIMPLLKKSVDSLMKSNAVLNDDMIVFLEKGIGSYKLNYHIIKAIKSAKKIGVEIPALNNNLYLLLNYFNTFKYEMISNIGNTYYLLNIYKLLEKIPLMLIHKESFNYLNENKIKINFENIFGENINIKNTTLEIKISENEGKNPKLSDKGYNKKKSSYDLEDEEENQSNLGETSKEIKIEGEKKYVEFDLSKMIKGPGYFNLAITMKNKNYGLKEHIIKTIRSYSEIKIESVDFEIIDKIHDENSKRFSTLKFPNKFSEDMKANQDCSLIARVKISSQDGKKNTLMEQVFLRLRNKELNKSYNAYATKFVKESNEYFIGFELDDPVNMESYNGAYEIFIVMSDPTIKNILTWKFGEIVISFTKPSDPLDEQKALKNKLQPKMEPTFSPEVKREKNMTIATIFSGVILLLTVLLFVVLAKSNSNIQNFPKSTFAFLMNVLFVGVLGLFAYILFLFWTKYNILQTMFCFVVLFIPVSFIVYKALKNLRIEIVVDKEEEN